MSKLISFVVALAVLISAAPAPAVVLEAKAVADLVRLIEETKFTHKEDGLIFGFVSIQSCLYVSERLIILKNYCVPAREYPAKGFTIISPEFGMIDFYQEELEAGLKRDVLIATFPEVLKDYFSSPLSDSKIANLNEIIETLYYKNEAACWSTNASYDTGLPVVECSAANILHFDAWAAETQALTGDLSAWKRLMESLEASLSR